jgi:hypothetical protein
MVEVRETKAKLPRPYFHDLDGLAKPNEKQRQNIINRPTAAASTKPGFPAQNELPPFKNETPAFPKNHYLAF